MEMVEIQGKVRTKKEKKKKSGCKAVNMLAKRVMSFEDRIEIRARHRGSFPLMAALRLPSFFGLFRFFFFFFKNQYCFISHLQGQLRDSLTSCLA